MEKVEKYFKPTPNYLHGLKEAKKSEPTHKVARYEFRENKGINGILLPDGEFMMCRNREHYILVEDISFDIQKQCVYFSSVLTGKNGILTLSPFGDKTMTTAQKEWIERHMKYLDTTQINMYGLLTTC